MTRHFSKAGFTLIEILIVLVIFSILSVCVIVALDPLEMINRGRDTGCLTFIAELYNATDRMEARERTILPAGDVVGATLDSNFGVVALYQLMDYFEIKPSFISSHQKKLPSTYVTITDSFQNKAFCFLPKSKAFGDHFLTVYSIAGEKVEECPPDGCYLCFSSIMTEIDSSASQIPGGSIVEPEIVPEDDQNQEDDICGNFDPQWPNFPWTFGTSDTFSQWGCTHFTTTDWGCDSFCSRDHDCTPCPAGQRKLVKYYYATPQSGGDWELCLNHWRETKEEYCVSDPYARCDLTRGPVGAGFFNYGCSDPRRPISFIEEYFK